MRGAKSPSTTKIEDGLYYLLKIPGESNYFGFLAYVDEDEITVEYDWNQEGVDLFLVMYNGSGESIGQIPLLENTFTPVTNLIAANNEGKNVVYEPASETGPKIVDRIILDY